MPRFSIVPEATLAAVSSEGVFAIWGITDAWAGRTSVSARPVMTAPA